MNRPLKQLLQSWQAAGLTHLPKSTPASLEAMAKLLQRASTAGPAADVEPPPVDAAPVRSQPVLAHESAALPVVESSPVRAIPLGSTMSREERVHALQQLADRVASCQKCAELAGARTQTVFGVGNPEARVMFIGEAPGADEDAQGEPFVGKAGQLLNKIIQACGWQRDDVYICNILRCRPPGNRTPERQEADNCREYLDGQIQIVNPEFIVCWGSCAAQNLMGVETPIGRLRGEWYQHGAARVLCTYHPSYLLRNPSAKKPVWEDMKLLLAEMGLTPPAK